MEQRFEQMYAAGRSISKAASPTTVKPVVPSVAIFSDMDGTMFDHQCTEPTPKSTAALDKLNAYLRKTRVPLVYITGRPIDRVDEAIRTHGLLQPVMAATDVGSNVYVRRGNVWKRSMRWAAFMRASGIIEVKEQLHELVQRVPGVKLQPHEFQREFKVSYYADPHINTVHDVRAMLNRDEVAHVAPGVKAVVSGPRCVDGPDSPRYIFIDFLPINGSKANAAAFIAAKLGLTMEQVFYADDSANGIDALNDTGMSVLVGTDEEDIVELLDDDVYVSSLPNIFGVIDGLKHFDILNEHVPLTE